MPKSRHGAPLDPESKEELLKKPVLEVNEWGVDARVLLEMLAEMSPREFTVSDLIKVSAEEIRGSAQAYADAQDRTFLDDVTDIGILEIEQWLDSKDLALSETSSFEEDAFDEEDIDDLLGGDN